MVSYSRSMLIYEGNAMRLSLHVSCVAALLFGLATSQSAGQSFRDFLKQPPPKATKSPYHTWTDVTGSFKVEARFVRRTDDTVVLERRDGKEVAVPIAKLSKKDRAYLAATHPPKRCETLTGRPDRTEYTGVSIRNSGKPVVVIRDNGFRVQGMLVDIRRTDIHLRVSRVGPPLKIPGSKVKQVEFQGEVFTYNGGKHVFESGTKIDTWNEFPKQRDIKFANATNEIVYVSLTEIKNEQGSLASADKSFAVPPGKEADAELATSWVKFDCRTKTSDLVEVGASVTASLSESRFEPAKVTISDGQLPPRVRISTTGFRQGSQTVAVPKEYVTTYHNDIFGDPYSRTVVVGGGSRKVTDRYAYCFLEVANQSSRGGDITVTIEVEFEGSFLGPKKREYSGTIYMSAKDQEDMSIKIDAAGLFSNGGYRVTSFRVARAWMHDNS